MNFNTAQYDTFDTRRTARTGPGFQAMACVLLFLLIVAVSMGPQLTAFKDDGLGATIRQTVYLGLLFLTILGVQPWKDIGRLFCVPAPLVAALVICAITLSWSDYPGIGLSRLVLTGVLIWTVAILVRQLGFQRSLTVIRYALLLLLIANYIAVFAYPTVGIHQVGDQLDLGLVGDWRGVMGHKNFAGAMVAFTAFVFLFDARRMNVFLRIAVIAGALFFLALSQSKTSAGMFVASSLMGYLFGKINFTWRLSLIPIVSIAALGAMAYLSLYRYAFVQLASDPETFTGRIIIWRHMLNYIGDNPWLGSGYGSFWNVGHSGPIFRYSADWVNGLGSGHNGYLDIAATLGIPLAIACVFVLLIWPYLRLISSSRTTGGKGALLLALLTFCLGHNMTESGIMDRDIITNAVLVLTITMLWELTANHARNRLAWHPDPMQIDQTGASGKAKKWKGQTSLPF